MPNPTPTLIIRLLPILLLPSLAAAQSSVTIDFAGADIASTPTNPPDLIRTSTTTISNAPGYRFSFNPIVHGTGFLGAIIIPSDRPLGDVLDGFVPGQQRVLYGAMRNPPATTPTQLDSEPVSGTFSGASISLTFDQRIIAGNLARTGILNIHKPFGVGIHITSGVSTIETWTPPPPLVSEWHFDGNLQSVRESGLAPAAGPARIRYLDDHAFGPILGGPGQETTYPNPPTPQDVTQAQSAFGTTASFGLPPVGGAGSESDIVYRTSPPRNLSDPANRAWSRGLGLALFPYSRDNWPEDRLGQWTFIWDLYIPVAAWSSEFPVALIEDNHNNDSSADCFIRQVSGQASFGFEADFTSYFPAPAIQPGRWFRLALSSDGYRTHGSRVFVDGVYIGATTGDWLYASCKSTDPRYGDISSSNPQGTPVPPATWSAWGQFPSPWSLSPNSTAAPMASTVCLFSDLQGRGESIYIANLLFTDEAMTDAQIAALGGPSPRGIRYLRPAACRVDLNADGSVNVQDFLVFLQLYSSADPRADFNADGQVNVSDFLAFLSAYAAGC